MTAHTLLDRLDGVRQTGPGRWIAKCPAHDDRRPSLTIWDKPDGRVTIYCHAGCEKPAILDALGLTWGALFPPRDHRFAGGAPRRKERLVSPADALRVLAHEARIVTLLAGDLARGEAISEADRQRLIVAAGRLSRAEDACL